MNQHSSPPLLDSGQLKLAYEPHTPDKQIVVSSPTWSPDGRHAFYMVVENDSPVIGDSWHTLFAILRDSTHIRKLYQWRRQADVSHLDIDSLRWSPDSSRIRGRTTETGSVDLDGVNLLDFDPETGERRVLSRNLAGKPGSGKILKEPSYIAFSPNGKELLLTLGSDRITLYNKRLVRIDYATGKRHVLTSDRMTSFAGCWSPNGRQIAFIAAPDAFNLYNDSQFSQRFDKEKPYTRLHLYVMNADGRHTRRLTGDWGYFEQNPSWAVDGRSISFLRFNVASHPQTRSLWAIRPDGTGLSHVRGLPAKPWTPYPAGY